MQFNNICKHQTMVHGSRTTLQAGEHFEDNHVDLSHDGVCLLIWDGLKINQW